MNKSVKTFLEPAKALVLCWDAQVYRIKAQTDNYATITGTRQR